MTRRIILFAAIVTLVMFRAETARAQSVDARSTLEAAAKTMGATDLKSIRYSASGWFSRIGQTYGLNEDWPHYEVDDYTRVIDYAAQWSREDYIRKQGNYPTLGLLPMPEKHITTILSGNFAWDMDGDTPVPLTRM